MSARTLQRRLAENGKAYTQILEAMRRSLAESYLLDGRRSACEIAFLLGFSDASSFTRAFKRWTGQSPTAFRRSRASH